MLRRMKITKKLPLLVVAAAALVGLGVGTTSYFTSVESIQQLNRQNLVAVSERSKVEFTDYFEAIERDLELVTKHPYTIKAADSFQRAWSSLQTVTGDVGAGVRKAYVEENPHPSGQRHLLDKGKSFAAYDLMHARYHVWFRELQQVQGYHDVFLFDIHGNLVYSVFKEADFASNFAKDGGEWSATGLGEVYRLAMEKAEAGENAFADFAPYGPSEGKPAAFMARAIHDKDGLLVGVLAYQMPIERINDLMAQSAGFAESAELALVGEDGFMRNDTARTADVNDILTTRIDSPVLTEALATGSAHGTDTLYRGEPMLVEAMKFDYQGHDYVMLGMISEAEASLPITAIQNRMAITGLLLVGFVAVAGIFAARTITGPINRIAAAMAHLAKGNNQITLDDSDREDEIGEMIRSVEIFRENAIERVALEKVAQDNRAKEQDQQVHMERAIATFRGLMEDRLATVSEQMGVLRRSSETLHGLADNASGQADMATSSSDSASGNVSIVASATEELSSSVKEVANQTSMTTQIVDQAVEAAAATNSNVASLSESAGHVGNIISLIRDIAEQTNLLALNATIEAARAGDAGKGFAVVAAEVKQLADQTSKATDEIDRQVSGIQGSVGEAVTAIGNISDKVGEIKSLSMVVSSAVEEQHAATQEIASSAKSASDSTMESSQAMQMVARAIAETSRESDMVNNAAELVSEASKSLEKEVERFLTDVQRTDAVAEERLA